MSLEIALSCVARGWYVFPCKPRSKRPATAHGWKDAVLDEAQVRAWWAQMPDANVGIATGPSGLTALDCDHGLAGEADVAAFMAAKGLPETYAVRTGRRPEFGVQLYYAGEGVKSIPWEDGGYSGDVRGATGYVMAAGSIHPDSGEAYEVLSDTPVSPAPDWVKSLRPPERTERVLTTHEPVLEWRNDAMARILGKARDRGLSDNLLRAHALEVNSERMVPPLDEDELERIIDNACKWPVGQPDPQVVIGKGAETPSEPVDWRSRYLTYAKVRDAKPTEFLIDGFLALGSITALAAPVAQRKSLIALNVAHSLCTGEPLFGYFPVAQKPERVVYLCPEMGLASFSTRLKGIGLDSYIGDTLFCQTMDEDSIALTDLDEELPGAVVIIDTLTRFVQGDQNSSEAMSQFAKVIFGIKRRGATVLLLHHSVKGAATALTLDAAMRGSTELAAFVTCCWATRLKDPDDPYHSPSLLVNVKQRDFESKPFEVVGDQTCRMRIVSVPGAVADIKTRANTEAEAALASILKESPDTGINALQKALKAAGHKKGVEWVTKTRLSLRGEGVTLAG